MVEKVDQPQQDTPQAAEPVGLDAQVAGATPETPGGTEPQQTQPEPRTFTQAEVSAIQSKNDAQVAAANERVANLSMQQEIDRAVAAETQAQAKDQQAVTDGDLTSAEAATKQKSRQEQVIQDWNRRQQDQQRQAVGTRMDADLEKKARVMAAHDFAEKYEVDAKALLDDADLTTWPAMEAKARSLGLDKREAALKGTESYDSNLTGGASPDISKMSPQELAMAAYGDPETTRRNKAKRRN